MRRCYLSQHGLALTKQQDAARPLSDQGREDIARVAGFLSLFTKPHPDTIFCSDKPRARQSAEMFAEGWRVAAPVVAADLAPDGDPAPMLRRIADARGSCMVVGHLPYLQRLASHLLLGHGKGDPICFQNGGVVCLRRTDAAWQLCWQVNPAMFYPT